LYSFIGEHVNKKDFPRVHFYDQDFVDIYDRTWAWIGDFSHSGTEKSGFSAKFFSPPDAGVIDQFEQCFASFFLVYSNRIYSPHAGLDLLYSRQEESGAIRARYDLETGKPIPYADNPECLGLPLFAWVEYNLYHKTANKKRVKEVMPILQKYYAWIDSKFKEENGLYSAPPSATKLDNAPRKKAKYLVDFNTVMAINALYMSALGDILNDKEISFQYKRNYFSIKTRINSLMWDAEEGFYFDLDSHERRLGVKTIGAFWPLLAEIPNEEKAEKLIAKLTDPATFGTEHPFPSLSADDKHFDKKGGGALGSVYPPFTFMVIKGLEKYQRWELARDCAIRHLYYVLDAMFPEGGGKGTLWEAYQPRSEGKAIWDANPDFPRPQFIPYAGLSTITLMIENIVGLKISLPRKTVDWIIPNLEIMGIENMSLKRNMVTILSNKSARGWEIHMESEKLYYFTMDILGRKKKTLPIPSGKCSMLIDKL
jgi:neutral trehalase